VDVDTIAIAANAQYNALVAAIQAANALIVGNVQGAYDERLYNDLVYDGSLLTDVPPAAASQSATLIIYDEDLVVQCALTITTWDPIRVPSFKSRSFYIKLTGNTTIRSINLATSFSELRDENYPQTLPEARGKLVNDGSNS
jgi:hypothetical protein